MKTVPDRARRRRADRSHMPLGSSRNKWSIWQAEKMGSRGRCPLAAGGTVPPAAGGEPPPDPHLFFHKPFHLIHLDMGHIGRLRAQILHRAHITLNASQVKMTALSVV